MHRLTTRLVVVLLSLTTVSAQIFSTGVGSTQLPACGRACGKMNQAVQACSGVTTSNQGTWICFCHSAYLTSLYQSSVGVCDDTCTAAADQQALVGWYNGNCGTDFGASEHAAQAAQPTASNNAPGASTTSPGSTTQTGSSGVSNGDSSSVNGDVAYTGSWWSTHYKWIIMLFVIAIGLGLFAWLLVWLKRRHERRLDKPYGGFNEGITSRTTQSKNAPPPAMIPMQSTGRDSPIRTREAFMPYGYGYAKSESRSGSRTNLSETAIAKGSPLAHDGTTMAELEREADSRAPKKRVYVRERSIDDSEKF